MGAVPSSEAKTISINQVINTIETLIKNKCQNSSASNVEFIVSEQYAEGDIDISDNSVNQNVSFDAQCLANTITEDSINSKVMEDIKAQVQAKSEGLLSVGSESSVLNDLITSLSNEISTSFVNECMNNFNNDVKVTIKNNESKGNIYIKRNAVTQVLKLAAYCVSENAKVNKLISDINKEVKSKSKSTTKGAINNETMASSSCALVFCFLIAAIAAYMFFDKKTGGV